MLGVDYGTRRVGLAISDGIGLTARPLEVVERSRLLDRIRQIAQEYELGTIVIGLPTSLSGNEGKSARAAREMGAELGWALGLEVVYVDERFTSKMAEGALLESGMKRQVRKETVDKVAAAIILQTYLDRAGPSGNSPGDPGVEPPGIQ
jgi:putative holliday junction resolvase